MISDMSKIRNIGIIAHIDAGKTTTTERILFYTGTSHRMGNVDSGNTTTDFDPEESERGITIYSAAVTCNWKDCRINIIDTPGHVDFTAEVQRSLRVLDGGAVIFSAVEGVEAQSETVWRQADEYKVPRLCFINKIDRIGADFERTLKQIESRLKGKPVPVTIPIGQTSIGNDPLRGVIDIIEMKALYFDPESKGLNIRSEEIPEDYQLIAETWRANLLEAIVELDEEVMEKYLEGAEIPKEDIRRLLRKGTLEHLFQPTFSGSSLSYIGVQPLLDGVNAYLPSPLDCPPVTGENPNSKKEAVETRKPDVEEPVSALIFKIVAEQHADLCFVRVFSGRLKSGSRLLNVRTGKKEMINQLWHIQADQKQKLETDEVLAGDICGVIGPKDIQTGDTLSDPLKPILLESIHFPETVISMAVEPDNSADRKKLADVLEKLSRQDPTFRIKTDENTGQTIISGMGELHLEVISNRIKRDFNLKVRVHKPRVSYRETVKKAVTATGTFERRTGDDTQYFQITVKIEPFTGEQPVTIVSQLKPDALPKELRKPLDDSIRMSTQRGGLLGYPLMNVKVTLVDVDYKQGESTELALSAATAQAVMEAFNKADMALMEPVMKLEVVSPEEFIGNIQADLQSRRASITGQEQRGHLTVLDAEVPLAKMFGYSTQVRSLSQGRASYSMEPLKYDLAPPDVQEKMMF
ncbi:elongation factor G [Lacunimicrobium album]